MSAERGSQRGAALVVALVMLVLLTLIAAMGARIALTDEKGARATRERQLAFEGAEAALRDAEDELLSGARAARFEGGAATGFAAVFSPMRSSPGGVCASSA